MRNTRFKPSSRPVASYHSASVCEPLPFPPPPMAIGGNSLRERNVRVGGTAFEARSVAEKAVHVAHRFEQRRILGQLSRWPRSQRANILFAACRCSNGSQRDFVFHARLHRIAKRAFHSIEFGFVFGAQVYFHRSARGNRIHRCAAFDDAEIVGAARIVGHADRRKLHDAARERGDGIRSAEIGPAVSAGAGDA